MFGNFFLKQFLKSQLKNVSETQREQILNLIEKNPEFFKKIAIETQEKIKQGKNQQTAVMEVMQAHQEELQGLLK
ncbi:MAG: hypothetical protein KAR00_02540 [Candidatus Pacebacteria bacterium]|nr:hypothetical protein [Candidatus Paceibacterota bacterium]